MTDENKAFRDFTEELFTKYFKLYPMSGSSLGLHEYDGLISDISESGLAEEKNTFKLLFNKLKKFSYSELSAENKFDYEISKWGLESLLFETEEVQKLRKNPMSYAFMFGELHSYISRDYAPFEERISSVIKIIDKIPSVLKNAEKILEKSIPEVFCKYAKSFSLGYENFFRSELNDLIQEKIKDEKIIEEYKLKSNEAVNAFEGFVKFLDEVSSPDNESFRYGKEKFERMLKIQEQIDISVEELKRTGESELERLQGSLSKILKENNFEDKLETLEHHHPDEDNLLKDTEATLGELIEFIKDNDIVNIPDKLNCIVTEMPKYMNFGFAAMGTAGPFEKSDESFYYVNLPDSDWSVEKKEEWLTQFNYPTLKLISIHEAYPGHYTHFLNSNKYSSKISNLFMSYSYVEGWAHYTEEMMLEKGYDSGNFKTRIGQMLEALIRCCRFLVSIGIHCENMSIKEAAEFFRKNAYMTEVTSLQEAERGAFDPGYLNYTLGKIHLKNLKIKYFNKFGNTRTERQFHDKIVSLGSPTYAIAEKYILEEI